MFSIPQTARPLFENPPGLLFHVGKWWGERDPGDAVAGLRPPGQGGLRAVPLWGPTSPCESVGVRRRTSTKDASPWRRLRAGCQMASTRLLCWGRGSVFGHGRSGSALPRRGPPPLQGRPWNEGGDLPDRRGDPPAPCVDPLPYRGVSCALRVLCVCSRPACSDTRFFVCISCVFVCMGV